MAQTGRVRLPRLPRPLTSGYALSAISALGVVAASGLAGVLATRALGPYQRGILATAVVWSALVGAISAFGMPQVATYFAARRGAFPPGVSATVISLAAGIGVATGVAGALISLLLVDGAASPPLAIAFLTLILDLPGGAALGTILGLGHERWWSALRLLLPSLTLLGVALGTSLGISSALGITCTLGVATLIQTVVLFAVLSQTSSLGRPRREHVRAVTSYLWRSVASGIGWILNSRLDQLVLSITVSPASLGVYAVAASFVAIISSIGSSIGSISLRRVAGSAERLHRGIIVRATVIAGAIASVFAAVVFVLAPELLKVVFGPSFVAATAPLRILMGGAIALSVAAVLADGLRGMGKPLAPARAEAAGALVTVALLPPLLILLGTAGAAVASTIAYSCVAIGLAAMVVSALRRQPSAPNP